MHKTILSVLLMPLSIIAHNQFFPANPFLDIPEDRLDAADTTARFMNVPAIFFAREQGTFARMFDQEGQSVDTFRDPYEFSRHTFKELKTLLSSNETSKFEKFLHLMDAVSNFNGALSGKQIMELLDIAVANGLDINTQVYYYEYNDKGQLNFTKGNLLTAAAHYPYLLQCLIREYEPNTNYTFYPDWYLKLNAYKLFGTHLS